VSKNRSNGQLFDIELKSHGNYTFIYPLNRLIFSECCRSNFESNGGGGWVLIILIVTAKVRSKMPQKHEVKCLKNRKLLA
jgi:hypothetical protein